MQGPKGEQGISGMAGDVGPQGPKGLAADQIPGGMLMRSYSIQANLPATTTLPAFQVAPFPQAARVRKVSFEKKFDKSFVQVTFVSNFIMRQNSNLICFMALGSATEPTRLFSESHLVYPHAEANTNQITDFHQRMINIGQVVGSFTVWQLCYNNLGTHTADDQTISFTPSDGYQTAVEIIDPTAVIPDAP